MICFSGRNRREQTVFYERFARETHPGRTDGQDRNRNWQKLSFLRLIPGPERAQDLKRKKQAS
jgi:hypothetical protein